MLMFLFLLILIPNINGKECKKYIEYRVIGQIVEDVKESQVNCSESYCTHVTIDVDNTFTGFEWGCRSDMDRVLSNLLIISPDMNKEVGKIKEKCNNLTSYTSTGDIQNINYKISVNCFKNSSSRRNNISITSFIKLIIYFIPFIFIKLFF